MLADDGLLWHAPPGRTYVIAVPKRLVPAIPALTHGTYGHLGVARITILIETKYHWTPLAKDPRSYVLSCKCRQRKRVWSRQLDTIPARLLQPWEELEMDIQEIKGVSDKGNRYLLVVVDRASKFLPTFPLPSKDAVNDSRNLLELLLILGLPSSIRYDLGSEFTADVTQHLSKWLDVRLDFGPTNHPRAQGVVERLGEWLHEALPHLCAAWPRRWDNYLPLGNLDPPRHVGRIPSWGGLPYRILFGWEPRSHVDATSPGLDGASFGQEMERTVQDQRRMTREILDKRQEAQNKQRERHNARLDRESPGTHAAVGDLVLVKEPSGVWHRDGQHPKLAHDHYTSPWGVTEFIQNRLYFTVQLNGPRGRLRKVAATDVKPYHVRPRELQLTFEDECAHLGWPADLGMAALPSLLSRCTP